MSVNTVKQDGSLQRIAGGTLYADAPIGTISPFGGSVIPNGYLLCNGQAVSRTTYAELFAVIGTAFGSGDGSTTFNIPDLREAVPKGVGLSGKSSNHYDSDGVALGEFIEDRIQDHRHEVSVMPQSGGSQYISGNNGGEISKSLTDYVDTTIATSTRKGATTEVKSVGVNYIIKAKQVAVPADFAPVDIIKNGNMKPVTSNVVYNTLMNTTIIQSSIKRRVTQDPTISTWYNAELQKPTIPAGKRLVRWLGFTDTEKVATSVGSNHGGVDNCILVNGEGEIGDSTPITFNIWWGAEIADC